MSPTAGSGVWAHRAPDFVREADVVAGLLQREREGRDALVPHRTLQDRAEPRLPEELSRQQARAAAAGTASAASARSGCY